MFRIIPEAKKKGNGEETPFKTKYSCLHQRGVRRRGVHPKSKSSNNKTAQVD